MGTRADFYIQHGETLIASDWIGSIAWDGNKENYPKILAAKSEKAFVKALQNEAQSRDDFTSPEMGWPWPWDTSATTDCAYVFKGNKFLFAGYTKQKINGKPWPNMGYLKKVTLGPRSGLIVISR